MESEDLQAVARTLRAIADNIDEGLVDSAGFAAGDDSAENSVAVWGDPPRSHVCIDVHSEKAKPVQQEDGSVVFVRRDGSA